MYDKGYYHSYIEKALMPNNLALELVTHRNTRIRENTRISFRCYSDP